MCCLLVVRLQCVCWLVVVCCVSLFVVGRLLFDMCCLLSVVC